MELAIFLSVWYIIGFISCVAIWKIDSDELKVGDVAMFFIFGIFGIIMAICFLEHSWSKVLWKSKKCKKSVDETTKV
jgi:hypothetical protein